MIGDSCDEGIALLVIVGQMIIIVFMAEMMRRGLR